MLVSLDIESWVRESAHPGLMNVVQRSDVGSVVSVHLERSCPLDTGLAVMVLTKSLSIVSTRGSPGRM